MSAVLKTRLTEAEYLAFERSSEFRHEFYGSEIFAMAGASAAHNLIAGNLFTELNVMLRGKGCRPYTHDMRVYARQSKTHVYPDIVVACPPIEFRDEKRDTLLNPQVVVEVLSPSTEAYDRGRKFDVYREAPSLQQYVLLAQDSQRAVSYVRQSDGVAWLMTPLDHPSVSIHFPSLDISVPLSDIYRDVELSVPMDSVAEKATP
jgi:Uma2 family endonuclease